MHTIPFKVGPVGAGPVAGYGLRAVGIKPGVIDRAIGQGGRKSKGLNRIVCRKIGTAGLCPVAGYALYAAGVEPCNSERGSNAGIAARRTAAPGKQEGDGKKKQ